MGWKVVQEERRVGQLEINFLIYLNLIYRNKRQNSNYPTDERECHDKTYQL